MVRFRRGDPGPERPRPGRLGRRVTSADARNVLVIGYYGAGNTGDEAVLTSMLRGLRGRRNDLRFIVPGENPERLSATHGVTSFLPGDLERMLDAVETADLVIL